MDHSFLEKLNARLSDLEQNNKAFATRASIPIKSMVHVQKRTQKLRKPRIFISHLFEKESNHDFALQ